MSVHNRIISNGVMVNVVQPFILSWIHPSVSSQSVGIVVSIHGSNFFNMTELSCWFDDVIVPAIFSSPSELLCKTPAWKMPQIVSVSVNGRGSLAFEFLSPLSIQRVSPTVGLVSTAFMVAVEADGLVQSAICKVNDIESVCLLENPRVCKCLISVGTPGLSHLYLTLHQQHIVFVAYLQIVKIVRVSHLNPQRDVRTGESIQVYVDSHEFGSIFCVFGSISALSIRISHKLLVCTVPPHVYGNVSLSFLHFDSRLPQDFALNVLDDIRIVSFSPHLYLSGSQFELRMQLSRQCNDCVVTCTVSCILEDFSISGHTLTFNVIGSTGILTLSLFEGPRIVGESNIRLVAWPTINLTNSDVHVFVGIEGFIPFRGHVTGVLVSCNFGNTSVDAIVSFDELLCPFNFSIIGVYGLTLSIGNQSRSTVYASFFVHDLPKHIVGSVFNSVFIISGFEDNSNLTWTCKFGFSAEVVATEVDGRLLCPIPVHVSQSMSKITSVCFKILFLCLLV